jgi:UDP-N-acetylglucosamine--N-acetylmuramyl-(pentapeptide) pyrophosphoryl-undecaprenol N-acetylglucosamine transferase
VGVTVQRGLKKKFGFSELKPLLVVTGGSLGAQRINEAVAAVLPELLKVCSVGLVAGRDQYHSMIPLKEKYEDWEDGKLKSDFRMWEFTMDMAELLKAADVVVSRAGATTIAELAVMKKAVILVPNAKLPGKHQVKNAEKLIESSAVKAIDDEKMSKKPEILLEAVQNLMRSEKKREALAENLAKFAKKDAALELAKMVIWEA